MVGTKMFTNKKLNTFRTKFTISEKEYFLYFLKL